jgi:hypothetical protein
MHFMLNKQKYILVCTQIFLFLKYFMFPRTLKWLILEIIMEMCTFEYVERLERGHQAVQQYTYKRTKQVL